MVTMLVPGTEQALATFCRMESPCLQDTLGLLNPKDRERWFLELCSPKRHVCVLTPSTYH